jgi:hypothetical protein
LQSAFTKSTLLNPILKHSKLFLNCWHFQNIGRHVMRLFGDTMDIFEYQVRKGRQATVRMKKVHLGPIHIETDRGIGLDFNTLLHYLP